MGKWKKEIPVEAGFYWFYGLLWGSKEKNELTIIEVWRIKNKNTMFFYKGHILTKEKIKGVWFKIIPPKIPEGINNENNK